MLHEEGIPSESVAVNVRLSSIYGGKTEYYINVEDQHYTDAIAMMVMYFGFVPEDETPYTGECPACKTMVVERLECPDCGLCFSPGIPDGMKPHPFYIYLKQNDLLFD